MLREVFTMTHTIVGLFNDRGEAQRAIEELVQNGFIRENIDISNRRFSDDTTTGTVNNTTTTGDTSEGIGDSSHIGLRDILSLAK